MGELSDFEIGQTVELNDGRMAAIRYVGSTKFAVGDWVGVVLDDATGKNDGSVQGHRYFECLPGHGMFIRPTAARVIDQPTPKPNGQGQARANGRAVKTRPQSFIAGGLKRQSLANPAAVKRQSINAGSPTPGANGALRSQLVVWNTILGDPVGSRLMGIVTQQISNETAQLDWVVRQRLAKLHSFEHTQTICGRPEDQSTLHGTCGAAGTENITTVYC